jgi:ElaB/YqjD/DUF883 family membrane-anchored ribosome-binding protein
MSPEDKPLNAAPDPALNPQSDPAPAKPADEEKSPAQIRAEIDATRDELGDTVEALAEKTDVKAQAKAKVDDVKGQAQAKADELKSQAQAAAEEAKAKAQDLGEKAKAAAPESPQEGVQQAQALVRQNPKPAAIAAGLVVLFVLWRLLRS